MRSSFARTRGRSPSGRCLRKRATWRAGSVKRATQPRVLDQADIFHSSFFALPRRSKRHRRARRFLTVYDLTPLLFPHFFAFDEDQLIRSALASIEPEDWVLCISESCRQDLCAYRGIDPARVFVTHLAADRELFYP